MKKSSDDLLEAMRTLPPESRKRVAKVLAKLLRAPRLGGKPPVLPPPPAADEQK